MLINNPNNRKIRVVSFCFVLLAVVLVLFILGEQQRNWSQYADQDLTLAYNALQEYFDHPGFFTIHSLALLIKIKFLFGYSHIHTISDLNSFSSLFLGFADIVSSTHFLAFLSVGVLLIATYIYSRSELKDDFSAFFIALATLTTGSAISHFIHFRTEMISCLLLYLSIFIFFQSNSGKEKERIFCLYIALILSFFTLLNKVQLILYIPMYIFWAIYLYSGMRIQERVLFSKKIEIKQAICATFVCYAFFCLRASGLSILFYILYLSSLNGLVYFYWRKNGGSLAKQITSFNIAYLLAFGTAFLIIYTLLGYKEGQLFTLIKNPMKMLVFANSDLRGTMTSNLNIFNLASVLGAQISFPAKEILSKFNSESIFFYLNVLLLFLLKKQDRKNKINVLICLLFFYLIAIISSFRYRTDSYIIFSEFFLIVALISQISAMRYKKLFCFSVFIVLLATNFEEIYSRLLNTDSNISTLCSNSYMFDWHRQLDINKFYDECKAYEK
jgi:hypothetical protein